MNQPNTCEVCGEYHHAVVIVSSPNPFRWCSFECAEKDDDWDGFIG